MDFKQLDTKTPQEEGSFCHLRHTKFEHDLYSGEGADEEGRLVDDSKDHEPIGVYVRGMESPSVKKAAMKIDAALKSKNQIRITEDEAGLRFCEVLVTGFRGLTVDGKPAEASKETIRQFFGMSDNLVEQVLDYAKVRGNFFKTPSTS